MIEKNVRLQSDTVSCFKYSILSTANEEFQPSMLRLVDEEKILFWGFWEYLPLKNIPI